MTDAAHIRASRNSWWVDFALLAVLSGILYLPGLTHHGVASWQEAQRLMVARDMQQRWQAGEGRAALLVPTTNGIPYLAKPPMVYWVQLALAQPFGQRVELFHLRLAIALAGIAGVLATYLLARMLFIRETGWWSAALLATGILSTRSARIGELDVFLMPLCTLAIACLVVAWRHYREQGRTHWRAVLGATICTALAVLTKDPSLMIIAFGGYAAMLVYYANTPPAPRGRFRVIVSTLAGLAAGIVTLTHIRTAVDSIGAVLIAPAIFVAVYSVLPILNPSRLRAFFGALARTHPLIVLGVPIAIRLGWAAWVDRLVGGGIAGSLAKVEVEDNLRLFVAQAPLNNLEAVSYGVGVGSLAALAVLIWIVRARPKLSPAGAHLAAWIGFGLLAFSVLGKGVARYLTPMWPAIAIVGGWGVYHWLNAIRLRGESSAMRITVTVVLVVAGLGQTAWYGYGREALAGERSPAAMAEAIQQKIDPRERTRIFSFEFTTAALDYHFGCRVRPVGDPRENATMAGEVPWDIERLHRFLAKNTQPRRSAVVLMRAQAVARRDPKPPAERLRAAGFVLEPIELPESARFEIDRGRSQVIAFRATVPRAASAPASREVPDDDSDEATEVQ